MFSSPLTPLRSSPPPYPPTLYIHTDPRPEILLSYILKNKFGGPFLTRNIETDQALCFCLWTCDKKLLSVLISQMQPQIRRTVWHLPTNRALSTLKERAEKGAERGLVLTLASSRLPALPSQATLTAMKTQHKDRRTRGEGQHRAQ